MTAKVYGSITGRTLIVLAMIPLFLVSTLFVFFGYPTYTLLTQSLNTLRLMGFYWKMSDLAKKNEELLEDIQRIVAR